jgi:biotin synthase
MSIRHDWTVPEALALFALPLNDLMFRAASLHRQHHDPNAVQVSTLLSIKTGACPEDCAYCPQSARYDTGLKAERLMSLESVLERRSSPRTTAPRASAWARPGASRATRIWRRSPRWCAA